MKYVIELAPGVFLAPWDEDPGRTTALENAKLFKRERTAKLALGRIRAKHPDHRYLLAKVIEVEIKRKDSNEKA